ncbi:MAG: SurA N-terminal domain-containing protein [Halanaerobiales bacterium]|nr:SurA N-terminal domain-containing protein [Halanaerobiales bacterium]
MFDNLRNNSKIVVYIVVAAFVVTGGLMGFGSYMSRNDPGQSNNSQYIAQVNNKGITPQQYLSVLRNYASQANSLSQAEVIPFRLNVLNSMIEREILLTEAENMNIKVEITDQEVEGRIDQLLEENDLTKEELIDNLESQDYSYEQFKNDIRGNMINSAKIEQVKKSTYSNIEVSEKEIQDVYDSRYQDQEEKPDYQEAKSKIRDYLLTQEQNNVYQNWLENKKAEANVTINDPMLYAYNALDSGNYQVALDSFKNLIENDSESVSIYIYLARAYQGLDKTEEALSTYQKAIENYPDDWELRLNYGDYFAENDKNEKAIEQYDKASEFAGNNIYAHYNLFMSYNNIGASQKAEQEMQTITDLQQEQNQQSSEQSNTTTTKKATSIEEELEQNQQ